MQTVSHAVFGFPYPPSLNHCWGTSGKVRFLTAKYKAFLEDVALVVAGTRLRESDCYYVELLVRPPDRRKRDIDNVVKPILDALTRCCVWQDDCYVGRLIVDKGKPLKNGAVDVRIGVMEPGCAAKVKTLHEFAVKDAFEYLLYLKAVDGPNFIFDDAFYKLRDAFPQLF